MLWRTIEDEKMVVSGVYAAEIGKELHRRRVRAIAVVKAYDSLLVAVVASTDIAHA